MDLGWSGGGSAAGGAAPVTFGYQPKALRAAHGRGAGARIGDPFGDLNVPHVASRLQGENPVEVLFQGRAHLEDTASKC